MTEYSAIDAVNWSTLKHMATSPLAYRWAVDHYGQDDTYSRHDLRAIHVAVLTPEAWESSVYVAETRRSKAMLDAHPEQEVITAETAATCQAIAEAVRNHPVAGPIITGKGWSERVIQWVDPSTGLDCKGRIDHVQWTPDPEPVKIWDLKQMRPMPGWFLKKYKKMEPMERLALWTLRHAEDMEWCGQAAHYRAGVRVSTGRDCIAGLILYLMGPPIDVYVCPFEDYVLDEAEAWRGSLLARVAECRKTGRWPGVCEQILPLSMSDDGEVTIEEVEEEEP